MPAEKKEVAKKTATTAKKTTTTKKTSTATVKKTTTATTKKPAAKKDDRLKVLIVAGEATPFVKTGGLADVVGTLPKALVKKNVDARIMIPLHQQVKAEYRKDMKFIGFTYVSLAWRNEYCGVYEYDLDGVKCYFLDNERYFKRNSVYGEVDDGERFAFFSKAVLESLNVIKFAPNIIHANDWHTGLVPVYLDCFYRGMEYTKDTKTIYTIHNIEYQGKFDRYITGDLLGLNDDQANLVSYSGCANFMKGGIESAKKVTTVSKTYANEIMYSYYGYGMEDILRHRSFKLSGIINGISNEDNNPLTDKYLYKNYDLSTVADKKINKLELQKELGLEVNENIPMIAMVGRLVHQKGIDLVVNGMDRILDKGVQVVILGSGDAQYENALRGFEARRGDRFRAIIGFSASKASQLYAASDLFLMPSQFEPCGLSQMIAMRYGSLPIVRETGGLKDTVIPYNHEAGTGVGFTFRTYNTEDMLNAVERAVGLFNDYKEEFMKVITNAMSKNYDWANVADEYINLYKDALK